MKKRFVFLAAALAAMLLTGCALRTVEEMYALPKRSEEFRELQAAIDTAMYGMTYSSPQSGENQQTVQTADLNGDGLDEYLVFAKGATEKPLQVLIFQQDETGKCRVLDTIGFNGQAFDQVEYMAFDDQPGLELVVGIQVSERVLRNVAVYSFHGGSAELLLLNSYSKMLPCQLSGDKSELMVLRPGEEETQRGMAVLYGYDKGQIGPLCGDGAVRAYLPDPPDYHRQASGRKQCGICHQLLGGQHHCDGYFCHASGGIYQYFLFRRVRYQRGNAPELLRLRRGH